MAHATTRVRPHGARPPQTPRAAPARAHMPSRHTLPLIWAMPRKRTEVARAPCPSRRASPSRHWRVPHRGPVDRAAGARWARRQHRTRGASPHHSSLPPRRPAHLVSQALADPPAHLLVRKHMLPRRSRVAHRWRVGTSTHPPKRGTRAMMQTGLIRRWATAAPDRQCV